MALQNHIRLQLMFTSKPSPFNLLFWSHAALLLLSFVASHTSSEDRKVSKVKLGLKMLRKISYTQKNIRSTNNEIENRMLFKTINKTSSARQMRFFTTSPSYASVLRRVWQIVRQCLSITSVSALYDLIDMILSYEHFWNINLHLPLCTDGSWIIVLFVYWSAIINLPNNLYDFIGNKSLKYLCKHTWSIFPY